MVDKTIDEQPLLIAPIGADVPAAKTNTDYRIRVGEANGLATLDTNSKIAVAQLQTISLSGDVTGSGTTSIAVTILDDSHNHIIANVDGLQAELDNKLSLGGGNVSGTVNWFVGPVGTQQSAFRIGWNNGITRWAQAMETDGSFALYSYNSAGADAVPALSISTTQAGGTDVIRFKGNNLWHAGNFNPANYAPVSHTHTTAQITDLGSYTGLDVRYYTETETNTLLAGKANTSHSHVINDVTGLQAALDGKAAATHTHVIGDVTGLQAALDSKLDDSQATATGLDILNSANQDEARDAIGVYVQAGDPGAVADGSLWIW